MKQKEMVAALVRQHVKTGNFQLHSYCSADTCGWYYARTYKVQGQPTSGAGLLYKCLTDPM
ncbi:hypothetical protein E2C01_098174 [Portunus trituberculatus]|uniref:Uncharacterized protein n=1 Tax=Portunus trituberculatus TaxID=210409 RepID=A0A5B7K2B7_PORTR|nr:hypothetical protein [Portunus trituberculatus]